MRNICFIFACLFLGACYKTGVAERKTQEDNITLETLIVNYSNGQTVKFYFDQKNSLCYIIFPPDSNNLFPINYVMCRNVDITINPWQ